MSTAKAHPPKIAEEWDPSADVVLFHGDCLDLLSQVKEPAFRLAVTSPPYNLGKEYERERLELVEYGETQAKVLRECHRTLLPNGSLCWEVGNYVQNGEIVPLDVKLWPLLHDELKMKLRNRIIWEVPHGLHAKRRFSGRYETILWYTKTDNYYFDLDPVRVPVLWPKKKYFRGPRKGQYSSNPLGKNPADVWRITNVKANHPEKLKHPCQYPEELVARLVLALTKPGEWVLDPYLGSGTTAAVCLKLGRKCAAAEINGHYVNMARKRIEGAARTAGRVAGQRRL